MTCEKLLKAPETLVLTSVLVFEQISHHLLPHSFLKLRLHFCQHLIHVPLVVHKRILGGTRIDSFYFSSCIFNI